jgi:hypothetical protein
LRHCRSPKSAITTAVRHAHVVDGVAADRQCLSGHPSAGCISRARPFVAEQLLGHKALGRIEMQCMDPIPVAVVRMTWAPERMSDQGFTQILLSGDPDIAQRR